MKKRLCGLVLVGFTILMGVGVAYSQESAASPSAQEALEKAKAAQANKNSEEAKKWYRIGASQGNAEAQYELGNTLIGEAAVMQFVNSLDRKKADDAQAASLAKEGLDWWLKSANQEYAKAEYDLGYNYYLGLNVAADKEKGLIWIRKAATHDNEDAKKFLREHNLSY